MSDIEDDIENIKELVQGSKDYGEYENNKYFEAMENILSDYARQKQINEEHQKENGELREKVKELEKNIEKISESSSNNEELIEKLNRGETFTVNQLDFIKKKFIPKQKIKDIVFGSIHKGTVFKDEYIYPSDTCQYVVRQIVKELLQESEDK